MLTALLFFKKRSFENMYYMYNIKAFKTQGKIYTRTKNQRYRSESP